MILQLLIIRGQPPGKKIVFGIGDFSLGRGPDCHVRFNTDVISRQHCLIRVDPVQVILRDTSMNGTLVNGIPVAEDCQLADRDLLQIGPVVFQVELFPEEMPISETNSSAFFREVVNNSYETDEADSLPPK